MLTIRKAQIEAVGDSRRLDFENRMLAHLRECWASRCESLTEQQIRDQIRAGVEKARRYRVVTEYDAARFIVLMFAVAADFDVLPGAASILSSPVASARQKMDELCRCAENDLRPVELSQSAAS